MSILTAVALLELLAILFLALMLSISEERGAKLRAAWLHRDAPGDNARRRTRHLSPHRAAIRRMKRKEDACGRQ